MLISVFNVRCTRVTDSGCCCFLICVLQGHLGKPGKAGKEGLKGAKVRNKQTKPPHPDQSRAQMASRLVSGRSRFGGVRGKDGAGRSSGTPWEAWSAGSKRHPWPSGKPGVSTLKRMVKKDGGSPVLSVCLLAGGAGLERTTGPGRTPRSHGRRYWH